MIKVKKELRKRVERFLQAWPNTNEEYGGFLFVNRLDNVSEFLLIPNVHSSRKDTYQMPESAKALAEKYAGARKLKLFARWHNHPEPAVCSIEDCHAATCQESLYSVMISPTNNGWEKEYVWYFYKGIKPENVMFV